MNLTGIGGLQINARKASGAYPVSNVNVRIIGAEEANKFTAFSVFTNRDGNTPVVSLPAPDRSLSLTSGAAEVPYSVYDVEITAEGFYPKVIKNVAVFDEVIAILPINMIPLSEREQLETYPRGNLTATVKENANLE